MNSKRKLRASLVGIKDDHGNELAGALDIANELGTFFESTFVSEPSGDVPVFEQRNPCGYTIPELVFTPDMIKDVLIKLNTSKSCGPDHIHPKLLKCLSNNPDFVYALYS